MKPIKISKDNIRNLMEAIAEAEGRATQRTFPAAWLEGIAKRAETETALAHLPKAMHKGARVSYRMRLNLPNSYRYPPDYTRISIIRRSSGWYLDRVQRVMGSGKQAESLELTIDPAQDEEIARRIRQTYTVRSV